jgi:hypothetical protein
LLLPDLTLIIKDMSLFIEIDTGTYIKGVIAEKLEKYKNLKKENEKVLFFTKYKTIFAKYEDNQVAQFILIDIEDYQYQSVEIGQNG